VIACVACGASNDAANRFCEACGAVIAAAPASTPAGPAGPPAASAAEPAGGYAATQGAPRAPGAPGAATRQEPAVDLPAWLLSDWVLVGVTLLAVVAAVTAVGVVFGALFALVTTSSVSAIPRGALSGVYVGYSLWGVKSAVGSGDDTLIVFGSAFLPIPGVAVPIAAVAWASRFAARRIAADAANSIAFVVKLSLVLGIVYSIAAALLSSGSDEILAGEGEGLSSTDFAADVSAGNAFLYPLLIAGVVSLVVMWRHRGFRLGGGFGRVLRALWDGARLALPAYGGAVVVLGAVGTVVAVAIADTGAERLALIVSAPLILVNTGVALATGAMGASVAFERASFEAPSGYVSLFHFGLPAGPDAGAAPPYLFVVLAVAPIAVGWSVVRALDASRPRDEQQTLGVALEATLAFAVVAWLGALAGRVNVGGFSVRDVFTDADGIGGVLVLRPSAGAALGLGFAWALLGAFAAAFWWGSAHGIAWSFGKSSPATPAGTAPPVTSAPGSAAAPSPAPPTPTPLPAPPPSPASPGAATGRAAARFCLQCGTEFVGDARFCSGCGSPRP
jgi:hypothetical protein